MRAGLSRLNSKATWTLGLVLLAWLEYRDSSFKTEADVQRILTLPVLALVPILLSEKDRHAHQRRRLLVDLVGAAAVITSVAALILWRLQS